MYAQQQSQDRSPSTSSTQELTAAATQACDAGNQALVQEAGLDAAASMDLGLLGDMADMVLDTLPLSLALPIASRFLDEPAVQAWVQQQTPEAVVGAMALTMSSTLMQSWPVGLGIFAEGEVAAALGLSGKLDGEIELLRPSPDTVQARVHFGAAAGLAEVGAALGLSGGGEQAMAALGATGKLQAEIERDDSCTVDLQPDLLLALGASSQPGAALALLAGSALDLVAPTDLDLAEHFDPVDYEESHRLALVAEARAQASQHLIDAFPADMSALLEQLSPYLDALQGCFDGSYQGELELLTQDTGVTLTLRESLAATGDLAAVPLLAEHLDLPLLDRLSETLGGQGQLELVADLQTGTDGFSVDPQLRASVLLEQSVGQRGATDRIDFCLDELPGVLERLAAGEGLSALVAATGFQRSMQLPAPTELVSQVVPELATSLTDILSDRSVLAGTDDLHLEGTLTAGPEVMQTIADSGIQAPEGMGAVDALQDIHSALCALAGGLDDLPSWLEPWRQDVASAAAAMTLLAPKLVGQVKVAMGLEAKGTEGATVGGQGKGAMGFSVDRTLDGATASSVLAALAQGVFTLPASASTGDTGTADQADSGTETATSGSAVAASPEHPAL